MRGLITLFRGKPPAQAHQPPTQPSHQPPVYKPITDSSVKLHIDHPKEYYTNGDTISGCLIFQVSEPSYPVVTIKAHLTCLSILGLEGPEKRQDTTHFTCEKSLLPESEVVHEFNYGVHEIPFSFLLDKSIAKCPASFHPVLMDEIHCGVYWTLQAWIERPGPTLERLPLRDKVKLQVMPFDQEAELARYGSTTKIPLSSNLREKVVLRFPDLKIELHDLPEWIPQPPETFNLKLSVIPLNKVLLEHFTVNFRYVINAKSSDQRMFTYLRQKLGFVKYGQLLNPQRPPLTFNFDNLVLDHLRPSPFKLESMTLRYDIEVVIKTALLQLPDPRFCRVNLVSPSRLSHDVQKQVVETRACGNE